MPDLKNNITNDFGLSREITFLIQEVFSKFPKISEVKIFGSRALGNYRPGSDIDLAIFGSSLTHDDLMAILKELEELELLYEIDCIDYQNIKEPALREHIDLYGKTFFIGDSKMTSR